VETTNGTLTFENSKTHPEKGTPAESVVWLGRYSPEKVSGEPKGLLRGVGNILSSAKAKAGLTVFRKARNADSKEGFSDRQYYFGGSLV
jgi:hypothetical protein